MIRRAASSALHQRQHHFNSYPLFSSSLSSSLRLSNDPIHLQSSETKNSSRNVDWYRKRSMHSCSRVNQATSLSPNTSSFFRNHRIPVIAMPRPSPPILSPPTAHNATSKRMFSNQPNKNDTKPTSTTQSAQNSSTDDALDTSLLVTLGLVTTAAAFAVSPDAMREQRELNQHFDQDLDVEEDMYKQMKEVSTEVRGEITRTILGEEIADRVESGGGVDLKSAGNTADVVADVLNSEALQNAIVSLITRVIGSTQFQSACQTLLKNLWQDLVNDPETVAQIVTLLNTAIKDEKIKKSFKELLLGLLQDDEVYEELTGLVVRLGEDKEVLNATKELLTESTHQALNDPEILDHSMEFATDIVGDNVIQRTSGEALRNTVTYAFQPSLSAFLSIFGVALLFFSISALGQARMAATQRTEMNAATASLIFKRLGDNAWRTIQKVIAMPANGVAALAAAVAEVLMAPINLAGKVASSIARAGGAGVNSLSALMAAIISSPGMMLSALKNSLFYIQDSVLHAVDATFIYLSNLPHLILTQTRSGLVILGGRLGEAVTSTSRYMYTSAALHATKIVEWCKASLTAGALRSSTSFGIMFSNAAMIGKRQLINFNDAIEEMIARVTYEISNMLGRNRMGSVD